MINNCYRNYYIKDWVIDRFDIIAGSWLNARFDERDIAGFEAVGSQGGSVGQSLAAWRLELRQRLIPWRRPLSLRGLPRRQQGLGGSCHDATRMPGKS